MAHSLNKTNPIILRTLLSSDILIPLRFNSSFKSSSTTTTKLNLCPEIIHSNDTDNLIYRLHFYTTFVSGTFKVRTEGENNPNEKEVTDDSKKHGSFAYSETLWVSFFSAPYKWYDYRVNKKNKKGPDFRHIDTGEGLWAESGETPAWVLSKLKSLGKEAFSPPLSTDDLWKSFFADSSKWFDERKMKKSNKHPDFVNKETREALWIDNKRIPAWVPPMLENLHDNDSATSTTEDLWKTFFEDPSKWYDNRKMKKSTKYPDFKHKDTAEALWINDTRTLAWIISKLNSIEDQVLATSPPKEDMWKNLFADPSKWLDNRKKKRSDSYPDFKHKDTREVLWVYNKQTPSWVIPMLNSLQDEAFMMSPSIESLWKTLFADPPMWFDNRKIKKSNKHPDFVHKDTCEALWVEDMRNPSWVISELSKLGDDAFALTILLDSFNVPPQLTFKNIRGGS